MANPQRVYTPAEYLELERAATYKSEYADGEIYAMSGGTSAHSLVAANILGVLHVAFRGRSCRAYTSDMRVKVAETGMYAYPDVSALCGRPDFEDQRMDVLLNPSVIVEVLSPSTEAYDRGGKFASYRRMPSMCEYVLVAQDRPHVERYVRDGEDWRLTEYSRPDDVVALPSAGAALALRDVYERVEFDPQPRPRAVREDLTGWATAAAAPEPAAAGR